jgi:hypothetical protein
MHLGLGCSKESIHPACHQDASKLAKDKITMDLNTALKIRGCFIGIPGKRQPRPILKGDVHLNKVVADLHFVSSEWWRCDSRPEIANSDRSVWGMLNVSCDTMNPH